MYFLFLPKGIHIYKWTHGAPWTLNAAVPQWNAWWQLYPFLWGPEWRWQPCVVDWRFPATGDPLLMLCTKVFSRRGLSGDGGCWMLPWCEWSRVNARVVVILADLLVADSVQVRLLEGNLNVNQHFELSHGGYNVRPADSFDCSVVPRSIVPWNGVAHRFLESFSPMSWKVLSVSCRSSGRTSFARWGSLMLLVSHPRTSLSSRLRRWRGIS